MTPVDPLWLAIALMLAAALLGMAVPAYQRATGTETAPARGMTTDEIVSAVLDQLEVSDWSRAYVATDAAVVRVYARNPRGWSLAIGDAITAHESYEGLIEGLRARLERRSSAPELRLVRGGR